MRAHEPVLFEEVMSALSPRTGARYIDATVGGGGHAAGILELSSPDGRLLGIDRDGQALKVARQTLSRYGPRVTLVHGSFGHLGELSREHKLWPADGILLDLGLSSMQLSAPERGFSFQEDGPLDMRYDQSTSPMAEDLVNGLSEAELADLLYQYGEERRSRRIARAIVAARPLRSTRELAEVVARTLGRRGRIHPATRTFQALRIAVNDELTVLRRGLSEAVATLAPNGRLVVIAFHSLEDRVVKHFLRGQSVQASDAPGPVLRVLTRRPIQASATERERNPRSRSAKLRAAERLLAGEG